MSESRHGNVLTTLEPGTFLVCIRKCAGLRHKHRLNRLVDFQKGQVVQFVRYDAVNPRILLVNTPNDLELLGQVINVSESAESLRIHYADVEVLHGRVSL